MISPRKIFHPVEKRALQSQAGCRRSPLSRSGKVSQYYGISGGYLTGASRASLPPSGVDERVGCLSALASHSTLAHPRHHPASIRGKSELAGTGRRALIRCQILASRLVRATGPRPPAPRRCAPARAAWIARPSRAPARTIASRRRRPTCRSRPRSWSRSRSRHRRRPRPRPQPRPRAARRTTSGRRRAAIRSDSSRAAISRTRTRPTATACGTPPPPPPPFVAVVVRERAAGPDRRAQWGS